MLLPQNQVIHMPEVFLRSSKYQILKRIDTCICITESLCCTPETNTTLLINSTPTLNKKFKKVSKWSSTTYWVVCPFPVDLQSQLCPRSGVHMLAFRIHRVAVEEIEPSRRAAESHGLRSVDLPTTAARTANALCWYFLPVFLFFPPFRLLSTCLPSFLPSFFSFIPVRLMFQCWDLFSCMT